MSHFTEDEAWKIAKDLAVTCYEKFKDPSGNKLPDLIASISRSAAQIAAYLAQDFGSKATITGRLHLNTAVGALRRLESDLIIAVEVGLVSPEAVAAITPPMQTLDVLLKERKKAAQAEAKSNIAKRMSSGLGLDAEDE